MGPTKSVTPTDDSDTSYVVDSIPATANKTRGSIPFEWNDHDYQPNEYDKEKEDNDSNADYNESLDNNNEEYFCD